MSGSRGHEGRPGITLIPHSRFGLLVREEERDRLADDAAE